MKHNVLSYAVVGVFTTPLPGIPRFNPQFLATLLGDVYTTQVGIADGNLLAQMIGKPPQPSALFGPQRVQVTHLSIEQAAQIFGQLMQEAHTVANQQIPFFSQIGLNTDHEWIKPTFKPATRWLADHYVVKGLKELKAGTVAEAINLQFRLVLKDPDRSYNIQLQPRVNVEDGIYASINDHRDWNKKVPDQNEVVTLLRQSHEEIKARVTPLLLGGVADD